MDTERRYGQFNRLTVNKLVSVYVNKLFLSLCLSLAAVFNGNKHGQICTQNRGIHVPFYQVLLERGGG